MLQMVFPELPENSPRYVLLSYELDHKDGRKSFPLVLINWAPTSSETGLLTLHASAFLDFQTTVREFPSLDPYLTREMYFCFEGGRVEGWFWFSVACKDLDSLVPCSRSLKSAMVQNP
jgi:Cofilin/tropomyosin-type actin-binding protein